MLITITRSWSSGAAYPTACSISGSFIKAHKGPNRGFSSAVFSFPFPPEWPAGAEERHCCSSSQRPQGLFSVPSVMNNAWGLNQTNTNEDHLPISVGWLVQGVAWLERPGLVVLVSICLQMFPVSALCLSLSFIIPTSLPSTLLPDSPKLLLFLRNTSYMPWLLIPLKMTFLFSGPFWAIGSTVDFLKKYLKVFERVENTIWSQVCTPERTHPD